ncbi:ABC-2 transporter permease [Macrococcus hajekii]|nr:ABC-2 transporter permease [Macrococcus hajekii]
MTVVLSKSLLNTLKIFTPLYLVTLILTVIYHTSFTNSLLMTTSLLMMIVLTSTNYLYYADDSSNKMQQFSRTLPENLKEMIKGDYLNMLVGHVLAVIIWCIYLASINAFILMYPMLGLILMSFFSNVIIHMTFKYDGKKYRIVEWLISAGIILLFLFYYMPVHNYYLKESAFQTSLEFRWIPIIFITIGLIGSIIIMMKMLNGHNNYNVMRGE